MVNRLSALVRRRWSGFFEDGAFGSGRPVRVRGGVSKEARPPVESDTVQPGPKVRSREDCLAAEPILIWPADACRVIRELKEEVAELSTVNSQLRDALRVRSGGIERELLREEQDGRGTAGLTHGDERQTVSIGYSFAKSESSLVANCELLRLFDDRLSPPLREIQQVFSRLAVLSDMEPGRRRVLNLGIEACQELERGLRNILELRAACLDCISLCRSVVDMDEVLEMLRRRFEHACRARTIDFLIRRTPDVPKRMVGDPERIGQILFHLVDNAVRCTRGGQVRVEVDTLPHGNSETIRLSMAVHDTGRGIPGPLLERLSGDLHEVGKRSDSEDAPESGSREGETGSHGFGGLGVGLVMVRKLVGLMDGQFRLESLEGAYTSAYCVLSLERLPGEDHR